MSEVCIYVDNCTLFESSELTRLLTEKIPYSTVVYFRAEALQFTLILHNTGLVEMIMSQISIHTSSSPIVAASASWKSKSPTPSIDILFPVLRSAVTP